MTKEEGREHYKDDCQIWRCREAKLAVEYATPFCPVKYANLQSQIRKLPTPPDDYELECIIDGEHWEFYASIYSEYVLEQK